MAEITRADTWEALRAQHRWIIPDNYNLAWDMCEKWAVAEPDRLALVHVADQTQEYTFRDLSRHSSKIANIWLAAGIGRGDRVGVLLPQVPETVLCHLAAYRIGAVIVPLFVQFGADGLGFRLGHSGAKALVTDRTNLPKIAGIRDELPALEAIWCIDGPDDGAASLPDAMDAARDRCPIVATGPEDPAFISYTSGTTGPPKGAQHAHRVLLGHVPGVQVFYDFWPQPGDRIWTPSDWAWLGGLGNVMMPALRFGVPLIAHRAERFDPEEAFALMTAQHVTSAFLAPTALKLMRQVPDPHRHAHRLRSVGSGGESLGTALLDWGREALGLTINEFYGQTECNLVLGNNARIFEPRAGSMGRPIPGKKVTVLRPDGSACDVGEAGEIAVRRGDPAMFLGYWQEPGKTADKFVAGPGGHDYLLTGDECEIDAEGYFWFSSRTDDVITSSGYRIGPSEIEDCLNRHPSVTMSACIGVPDDLRTEIIKAFIVLSGDVSGTDDLKDVLIAHVRTRLSPHVAPRIIEWTDTLPMTATGKIMRRTLRAAQ